MSDSMEKHFATLEHQDWTPVVVKKKNKKGQQILQKKQTQIKK